MDETAAINFEVDTCAPVYNYAFAGKFNINLFLIFQYTVDLIMQVTLVTSNICFVSELSTIQPMSICLLLIIYLIQVSLRRLAQLIVVNK